MEIKWQKPVHSETVEFFPVSVDKTGHWGTENELFYHIGLAASMSRLSDTSLNACKKRVLYCIKKGHHSILEHVNLSVIIGCDRGTTHAIVRHRHCAFTQSSTVYGKIDDRLAVTNLPKRDPVNLKEVDPITEQEVKIYEACAYGYKKLKESGMWAERTRDHLPTSFHSFLFMTTNLREWIYFIQRRKDPTTSVRIHCVDYLLEQLFREEYPIIYSEMENWYAHHPLGPVEDEADIKLIGTKEA